MTRIALLIFCILSLWTAHYVWKVFDVPPPDLSQKIQIANSVLERARTDHSIQYDPALNWLALPKVKDAGQRKSLFIAKILPLIAEQNERILRQRFVAETAPVGSAQYNALTHSYRLKTGALRTELLKRVDMVPESLTLAQAAIESGWGTSRFAQLGHAYFGERTYDKSVPGMAPLRATGFTVKKFVSPAASIRSFMHTINSHRAYRAFRNQRAKLRATGTQPTGQDLAPHLKSYSEIGNAYIERILITIRANHLNDFDGISHVDH